VSRQAQAPPATARTPARNRGCAHCYMEIAMSMRRIDTCITCIASLGGDFRVEFQCDQQQAPLGVGGGQVQPQERILWTVSRGCRLDGCAVRVRAHTERLLC